MPATSKQGRHDNGDGTFSETVYIAGGASGGASSTIAAPLGRAADTASVSTALSTEDVALLNTLLTITDFDSKVGSLTEAAPASDTASSGQNGRLQRIAQRLTSLIALFPAALGRQADASSFSVAISTEDAALLGALTETAPAIDTASSGLNGRLQRIAQNITTLFGRFVAAATLGDATAKPSTTAIGAWLVGYNGATGDLVRVSSVSYDMSAITITTIATVATPTSGKQIRLMSGTFSVSSPCSVLFENNAGAGGTIFRSPLLLANTPYSFDLSNGVLVTTANHVLKATASTGTVTITGTLRATEE